MKKSLLTLAVFLALPAFAQHHGTHQSPTQASPYAGQQDRGIKALSGEERRAWLEGQGMGLAKAAELNGYPGPMHVLELAAELGLSPAQAEATQELMKRHKSSARLLGRQLVETERQLDTAFREQRATDAEVDRLTARIGNLQASIRSEHLRTHLQQAALLTPEQIGRYSQLRGYR